MARTRLVGQDLNLFDVDSAHYLGFVRTCEIERRWDTQENRALKDAFHFRVAIIEDWTVTFTIVADNAVAGSNMTVLMGRLGAAIAFSAVSAATNGTHYSGTGVLESGRHSIPDGLQEGSFTLTCGSQMTIT